MRALFVIILLATLLLPSGHGHASPPPIDISAENLQALQTQAAQGNAEAQYNLGLLYYNGRGVPQDNVRAYMWFNIATAHSTGYEQRLAADKRDKFAQRMTPAQVAEAQRLSQKCQAQGLKGC
jgi:uncharacterized protein